MMPTATTTIHVTVLPPLPGNATDDTIYQSPATDPDPSRTSAYAFDRVVGPTTPSMAGLYRASTVPDVVRASMEGYHASVFAYGQTSTGKTHMENPHIISI
mmetsp:Transcript_17769/g.29536  ORF Transcript_17769/g.29536 Transcript_17769/m.29536 type:complete len:101 (+) Transcript_17769:200-502(+)